MAAAAAGSPLAPPGWSPDIAEAYPFRQWMAYVILWSMVTDLPADAQASLVLSHLGGAAYTIAFRLSPQMLRQGG